MKNTGFTLIELLVVIAIIGMMSSVVLSSLNTARTKAYNSAIISSINSYVNALTMSYHEDGGYPGPNSAGVAFACIGATTCVATYTNYANIDTKLTRFFPGGPPAITPDTNYSNSKGFVYGTGGCSAALCNTVTLIYYLKTQGLTCPKGVKSDVVGWTQCVYTMN